MKKREILNQLRRQVIGKVTANREWLEKAILTIYSYQDEDEKEVRRTIHVNYHGFCHNEGTRGAYYAEKIICGFHLEGEEILNAMLMANRHSTLLAKNAMYV